MSLNIVRVKHGPKLKLPESAKTLNTIRPLWEVKIRSRLKPLHPFFKFELERLDIKSTIEFKVSIPNTNLEKEVSIHGVFPGFWFDESMIAPGHPFDLNAHFEEFEKYFFRLITKLLTDVATPNYNTQRDTVTLFSGKIEFDNVKAYMRSLLEPYGITARYLTDDNFVYNLVGNKGEFDELPVLFFNIDEMTKVLQKQTSPNQALKNYLLNSLVMALYHVNMKYDHAKT
jgi:hypothetical protein